MVFNELCLDRTIPEQASPIVFAYVRRADADGVPVNTYLHLFTYDFTSLPMNNAPNSLAKQPFPKSFLITLADEEFFYPKMMS